MHKFSQCLTLIAVLAILIGCSQEQQSQVDSRSEANVVEIVATGMQFSLPSEISEGWTTFRFKNNSSMLHFALIEKMPAGIGLIEQQEQVAPVFQDGMDLLKAGEADAAMATFGKLPEWFHNVQFLGGPGFLSAGGVSETTLYLEPGTYLVECYVKTGGIFHSFNPSPEDYGMVAQFEVKPAEVSAEPPAATMTVSISEAGGIEFSETPVAGTHVVKIEFVDQRMYENFVGHDLHLLKVESYIDLESLQKWMDWRDSSGLETPAPWTFIGGSNEMPGGSTAYLKAELAAGDYAWIAEVPDAVSRGMFVRFTVKP